MRPSWRCTALLAGLLSTLTAAPATDAAPTVILLSWDGVRADDLDRDDLPALA